MGARAVRAPGVPGATRLGFPRASPPPPALPGATAGPSSSPTFLLLRELFFFPRTTPSLVSSRAPRRLPSPSPSPAAGSGPSLPDSAGAELAPASSGDGRPVPDPAAGGVVEASTAVAAVSRALAAAADGGAPAGTSTAVVAVDCALAAAAGGSAPADAILAPAFSGNGRRQATPDPAARGVVGASTVGVAAVRRALAAAAEGLQSLASREKLDSPRHGVLKSTCRILMVVHVDQSPPSLVPPPSVVLVP
ncbi:hypothetical protein ACP4OV_022784 [Aristida adscensionis]